MGVKMEATIVGLFQEHKAIYLRSDAHKTYLFGNETWAALLFQILFHVYLTFSFACNTYYCLRFDNPICIIPYPRK